MSEVIISRVQKRRNEKFNRMLEHAMNLIVKDGFSSLKMRTLADSLDITPGALYRYFPSKGHIIGALGNQILETYTKTIQQATGLVKQKFQDCSPQERSLFVLGSIAKTYFVTSVQSSGKYRILQMIMNDETRYMTNPEDYDKFMSGSIELLNYVAQQYEDAVQSTLIREGNSFERALLMLSFLHGILQLNKFGQEMPSFVKPHQIFSLGLSNHLLGLGAPKKMVDRMIQDL